MKPQNLKPALREFAGGYVNTDAGVVKDRGVGSHLQRNAGAYLGTAMFPVVGTGVGAVIDYLRKRPNIVKTKDESPVSARTAAALRLDQRPVLMGRNLKPALRELAARSERIVEFAQGQYVAGLLGSPLAKKTKEVRSAYGL